MLRNVSWRDVAPSALLLGVLLLYFDVLTAILLFAVIAGGVLAVRKQLKAKKER